MSKTPYEIRLDLLYLAQRILTDQNMNSRIQLENTWNMECEKERNIAERTGNAPAFPKFPDVPQYGVDEVIKMADTMNAFVSKNS